MPDPPTTGWEFECSQLQAQYTLEGKWQLSCYEQFLQFESNYKHEATVADFFRNTPVHVQRLLVEKGVESNQREPANAAWIERCPGVLMHVDTTSFTPSNNPSLDVYVHRPQGIHSCAAAIVYCHGGGCAWLSARHTFAKCARYALENQAVVFNVDYRLAPEFKSPAAVFDAVGVVLYVHQYSANLGVDSSRIAIMGDSGGGKIAASAALELARRGQQHVLKLCVPLFPVVSDIAIKDPTFTEVEGPAFVWIWNEAQLTAAAGANHNEKWYIYPACATPALLANCPFTAIVTSEFDMCRRMAEEYGRVLETAGRLVEFVVHPGAHHCWNEWMADPGVDVFYEDIRKLLATHL